MNRFIPFSRDQEYWLPPSMHDWLPENHLARFIVEVVDQLDLSQILRRYSGWGSLAYHPAVLLALLVYGYATGVLSSRKLEKATDDSLPFRFMAAELHPDHDTLANFRKAFLVELEDLLVQVLTLAQAMKWVRLGTMALDGTQLKANASRHKAWSHGHLEQLEAPRREAVQALLQRAATVDQEALAEGIDWPAEIARREARLVALAEAKANIAERVKARDAQAQQDYAEQVARRAAQRQAGQKPKGPEPQPPVTGPQAKDQSNLTDEEARIMPSAQGVVQGDNAPAAVATDSLLVIATTLTPATHDQPPVEPMLEPLAARPEALGTAHTQRADNGYFSQAHIEAGVVQQLTPLIALGRDRHPVPLAERLLPDAPPPVTADPVRRMAHALNTQRGRAHYGQRQCTVEPVFGIIKHVLGFRQFSLRGLAAVTGAWQRVTLAYHVKRMHGLVAA
jgi:transposase